MLPTKQVAVQINGFDTMDPENKRKNRSVNLAMYPKMIYFNWRVNRISNLFVNAKLCFGNLSEKQVGFSNGD